MNNHTATRSRLLIGAAICMTGSSPPSLAQRPAADVPFVLERTVLIPDIPVGPYSDYLSIDLARQRLFATPQAAKAVAVIDLKGGRVLRMLSVGNPHGLFFSPDSSRLFVADGASGDVKVFNTENYSLLKTIPLTVGADTLVYDPRSQLIYVHNGGAGAGLQHSIISVIDTTRMLKVADIPLPSRSLEGAAIDPDQQRLYVETDKADHSIVVIDLTRRQPVATWQLPAGQHRAKAITLDSARARLYVATRDSSMHGSVFVLNTTNGSIVATLSIDGWADGMSIDHKRNRLYVSAGIGHIDTFTVEPNDVYRQHPSVETAVLAKTSLYSSELDRLYVSVPHLGDDGSAQIMVFEPKP